MTDLLKEKVPWARLGLAKRDIRDATLIQEKDGCRLYRFSHRGTYLVLKCLPSDLPGVEPACYAILQGCGVPVVPVKASTDAFVLMEDLKTSPAWRLACPEDLSSEEVGAALGRWYRLLHDAGSKYLRERRPLPEGVTREIDLLSVSGIRGIAEHTHTSDNRIWKVVEQKLELVQNAYRALPNTFNYNDFGMQNLALSRSTQPRLEAVLFDFHLMGIGLPSTDCHNVTGGLRTEQARAAFWKEYGQVDPREEIISRPLSLLHGLLIGVRMPEFPFWAKDCLDLVMSGQLEEQLRKAERVAAEICSGR